MSMPLKYLFITVNERLVGYLGFLPLDSEERPWLPEEPELGAEYAGAGALERGDTDCSAGLEGAGVFCGALYPCLGAGWVL